MSENEKKWLREALQALRQGKDMTAFQHSSYLSTVLLKLSSER